MHAGGLMSDATKLPPEIQKAAMREISAEGLPTAIERQAAAGEHAHCAGTASGRHQLACAGYVSGCGRRPAGSVSVRGPAKRRIGSQSAVVLQLSMKAWSHALQPPHMQLSAQLCAHRACMH